jgi:FdhD protein
MARGRTTTLLVRRADGSGAARLAPDELIVEEPLRIDLDGTTVATTMRTPGHDFELAAGFCFTEGLLHGAPVRTVRYCATGSALETAYNVVTVDTGGRAPAPTARVGTTSSSCGWCGSTVLDGLAEQLDPLPPVAPWDAAALAGVPDRLAGASGLFTSTGAVHAAAAFTRELDVLVVREDIGRHNAVDKVVGRLLLDGRLPAGELGLYVSGRASFEIVQKAWAAGIGALVAVSAPSALAVAAARRAGITLVGFVRGSRWNLYAPV